MQSTSLRAFYRDVLPNLGERHKHVIIALGTGDFTNNELSSYLGWEINRVTPRVNELKERGLVEEKGKRPCKNTGRLAIVWGLRGEESIEKF